MERKLTNWFQPVNSGSGRPSDLIGDDLSSRSQASPVVGSERDKSTAVMSSNQARPTTPSVRRGQNPVGGPQIAVMLPQRPNLPQLPLTEVDEDADELIESGVDPGLQTARSSTKIAKLAAKVPTPIKAAAQTPPVVVQKRKPGRPKGWRKPQPAAAASTPEKAPRPAGDVPRGPRQAKVVALNTDMTIKRRRGGRPRKEPEKKARDVYKTLQAKFISFKCEWHGCKAELHNTETLRRHLQVVHVRAAAPPRCQWGKCADRSPPRHYTTTEDLARHLDRRHLETFVWLCGDGPKNSLGAVRGQDDDALPAYLFYKDGTQVTPSIRDQKLEDAHTYRKNQARLREMLQSMNDDLPDEDDEDMDEAMD
jgi:hypothetical protein